MALARSLQLGRPADCGDRAWRDCRTRPCTDRGLRPSSGRNPRRARNDRPWSRHSERTRPGRACSPCRSRMWSDLNTPSSSECACRTAAFVQVGVVADLDQRAVRHDASAVIDFPADPHAHEAPDQVLERRAGEESHRSAIRRASNDVRETRNTGRRSMTIFGSSRLKPRLARSSSAKYRIDPQDMATRSEEKRENAVVADNSAGPRCRRPAWRRRTSTGRTGTARR